MALKYDKEFSVRELVGRNGGREGGGEIPGDSLYLLKALDLLMLSLPMSKACSFYALYTQSLSFLGGCILLL